MFSQTILHILVKLSSVECAFKNKPHFAYNVLCFGARHHFRYGIFILVDRVKDNMNTEVISSGGKCHETNNKWGGVIENILWSGDYLEHSG